MKRGGGKTQKLLTSSLDPAKITTSGESLGRKVRHGLLFFFLTENVANLWLEERVDYSSLSGQVGATLMARTSWNLVSCYRNRGRAEAAAAASEPPPYILGLPAYYKQRREVSTAPLHDAVKTVQSSLKTLIPLHLISDAHTVFHFCYF